MRASGGSVQFLTPEVLPTEMTGRAGTTTLQGVASGCRHATQRGVGPSPNADLNTEEEKSMILACSLPSHQSVVDKTRSITPKTTRERSIAPGPAGSGRFVECERGLRGHKPGRRRQGGMGRREEKIKRKVGKEERENDTK